MPVISSLTFLLSVELAPNAAAANAAAGANNPQAGRCRLTPG